MTITTVAEFGIVSSSPLDAQRCADALATYPSELTLESVWQDGAIRLADPSGSVRGGAEIFLMRSRKISQSADLARLLGPFELGETPASAESPGSTETPASTETEPWWFTDVFTRGWSEPQARRVVSAIAAEMRGTAYRS